MKTQTSKPSLKSHPLIRGMLEGAKEAPREFIAPVTRLFKWVARLLRGDARGSRRSK